jgi:hypothetical protein
MNCKNITAITLTIILVVTIFLTASISIAGGPKAKAFNEAIQESMPLSPVQIEQIKRMQEERKTVLTGHPANVRVRTVQLNILPGMEPTKIIMLPAYSTSIAFFDQTGAIWPVKKAISGNPAAFAVDEPADKKSPNNIVTASCISDSGHSNLTIQLAAMDMPMTFPLQIAATYKKTPTIDGIVAVRINGFGPNAKPPVVEPRPKDPVSDDMISYLDGISPKNAEIVELDPPNKGVIAWQQGKQLFLRTSSPILWPAWTAAVRGPADTRVYELPDVPSILLSCDGQIKRYIIKSKNHK